MDSKVSIADLKEFAEWVNSSGGQRGNPPYLNRVIGTSGKVELFYHPYNPFMLERQISNTLKDACQTKALLIQACEWRGFEAQVSFRDVNLHSGHIYERTELLPVWGKKPRVVLGYINPVQRISGVDDEFMTCVAMLTAMVYQQALEEYPKAVFFMTDRWPVAVRIH